MKKDQEIIHRLQTARFQLYKSANPKERELRKEAVLRLEKDLKGLYETWKEQDRLLEVKLQIYSANDTFN